MLSGSIDPIDIDVAAIINETLSPAARCAALAGVAREELATDQAINQSALGYVPTHSTAVDGYFGASEDSVRPDGTILYQFDLLSEVFAWVYEQLRDTAPVRPGSGRFRDSIHLYADGTRIDPEGQIPAAKEYVFLSTVAYSVKIEGDSSQDPESRQAPDGVFQVVGAMAQQRFGDQVSVQFTFRAPIGEVLAAGHSRKSSFRTPAITITGRG